MSDVTSDFIAEVAFRYKDDPNGYRRDILRMDDAAWQSEVSNALVKCKRVSVSAGHGIGKTALAASLMHWFLAPRPNPAIVATANTEIQLKKKLARELRKINDRAINRDCFIAGDEAFSFMGDPTAQIVFQPWRESAPEAFAGTHEDHVLGVFDEASAIPDIIWTTFEGAMTTPGARWLVIGNPTRNTGMFHDVTHGKLVARRSGDEEKGFWKTFTVPSWESPFVSPAWVAERRLAWGEESDEWRVRVCGLPPRFSETQYIPSYFVLDAVSRKIDMFERWPLILGVDVGHTHDKSVIVPRRGKIVPDRIKKLTGMRTTDFASAIGEEVKWWREEHGLEAHVCVEYVGLGVGVVETLQDRGYLSVYPVHPGSPSRHPEINRNLRAELWRAMRDWFEEGASIPNDPDLVQDIANVGQMPTGDGRLLIESKEKMRAAGKPSPDTADALAMTFAIEFDLLPDKKEREPEKQQLAGELAWMGL